MILTLNHFALSILSMLVAIVSAPAQAQVTPATVNDTNTLVDSSVANTFTIKGGTAVGKNLFHSFQRLGLDANQTAHFLLDDPNIQNIQNILGRVVGSEASVINGQIQVTGGATPNLYLMNPVGIIFGAGASLNVPGSFTATTANGIGFGTDKWFSANGTNTYADLVGNPTSLAFTMNQPGAIVNAGKLSVGLGNTLVLAGGTVVSTSPISSTGGITIMAVPNSSLVRISQTGSLLSLEIPIAIGSNQPNSLSANVSVLSLPQLLTNGSVGSANGLTVAADGKVTVDSFGVQVKNGDMFATSISALGDPQIRNPGGLTPVTLYAAGRISTANIATLGFNNSVSGGRVQVTAENEVSLGAIYTGFSPNVVSLSSRTGNISVSSIRASSIFIDTPGTFRATSPEPIGTDSFRENGLLNKLVIKDNPDIIEFLASQGIPREQLVNSTSRISVRGGAQGNVIALGNSSEIRIQHGGDAVTGSRISIQTAPNTTNPVAFVTGGFDGFVPNSTLARDFDPSLSLQGISLTRVFVRPNQFPEGVSGSAVGIYVGNTDSQLYASLQSRPFVPPPIVDPPVVPPVKPPVIGKPITIDQIAIQQIQISVTQTQTTQAQATQTQTTSASVANNSTSGDTSALQRPQTDRSSLCPPKPTAAPSTRATPADRTASPCTIDPRDDAQILKILDEPPTPQTKATESSSQIQPGAWWVSLATRQF